MAIRENKTFKAYNRCVAIYILVQHIKTTKLLFFSMEKNTAPGHIYQSCWDIISSDLMSLFNDFHQNSLDIGRFNYGVITLLPKIKDANKIQQYRPICLVNVVFKIFTKTLMLRLEKVMGKIINKSINVSPVSSRIETSP